MVGGRDYAESQFNRATDAARQPGSSFKPYVYATALANAFKPTSVVVDGPVCIGNWCPQNYGRSYSGSITLTQAIIRSINVIPVKLSIALGKGNPKIGRAMIVATARRFGIRSPLPDTPSLPIGADEVNVLEHTVAYATFPNKGMAVTPHAILEVRSGTGDTIWRFDRDGKKPTQAISPQVASDMALMMSKVVEEGTAKRHLDGIKAAGKPTPPTLSRRLVRRHTGNLCAAWFSLQRLQPAQPRPGLLRPRLWRGSWPCPSGRRLKNITGVGPSGAASGDPEAAGRRRAGVCSPTRACGRCCGRAAHG
jgi:penicillin-binding protein 1A